MKEQTGRNHRSLRHGLGLALAGILLWPLPAGVGQVAPASQPGSSRPSSNTDLLRGMDGPPEPNMRKLEHLREDERRKRLQADTAKLVQLTNELKEAIDKASKDELSVDVVRKAAEIEKLARDVKDRMRS